MTDINLLKLIYVINWGNMATGRPYYPHSTVTVQPPVDNFKHFQAE